MTTGLAHDMALLIAVGFVVFYVILPLWASRQGIAWAFWRCMAGFMSYAVAYGVANQVAVAKGQQGVSILVGLVAGYVVFQLFPPRSRHIPAAVKLKVVQEYESQTGKRYNSRKMEIDHRQPFARGGSHTTDNLRLISKAANRRKGKKRPGIKDWL